MKVDITYSEMFREKVFIKHFISKIGLSLYKRYNNVWSYKLTDEIHITLSNENITCRIILFWRKSQISNTQDKLDVYFVHVRFRRAVSE